MAGQVPKVRRFCRPPKRNRQTHALDPFGDTRNASPDASAISYRCALTCACLTTASVSRFLLLAISTPVSFPGVTTRVTPALGWRRTLADARERNTPISLRFFKYAEHARTFADASI